MNTNKGLIPKLEKGDLGTAAIITKLNVSAREMTVPARTVDYQGVIRHNIDKIKNNDNITELFPDIEKCIQIITASILSPNNLLSTTISYSLSTVNLPDDLKSSIASLTEKYLNKEFNFEEMLTDILREAYFTKGSWAQVIVSEAAVDMLINGTDAIKTDGKVNMDNYKKLSGEDRKLIDPDPEIKHVSTENLSFEYTESELASSVTRLAYKKDGVSLEDKGANVKFTTDDLMFDITDDKTIMFKPARAYEKREQELSKESIDFNVQPVYDELYSLFRINDGDEFKEFVSITPDDLTDRKSIGKAMVFKIPVESLIPLYVINDPTKQIGFFAMLDEKGSPIRTTTEYNEDQMSNMMRTNMLQATENSVINRAKSALVGITSKEPTIKNIEEIYNRVVDDAIRKAIEKGGYDSLATIRDNTDIYRVMFFRALRSKRTKLVYIPAENMAFYAFDYRENGTGKSLIEKTAMLHSIRSILLFTKVLASIKNSTTTTKISIDLDENDTDPQGTIDMVRSEYIKTRASTAPFGLSNINDLVAWGQSAGIIIDPKGEAAGLPNMSLDISNEGGSKVIPDDSTDESVRTMIYLAYGLTPEIVESGYSSDFATSVVAKNLLFAKQTKQLQTRLMIMVTKHVRKLCKNDYAFKDKLKILLKAQLAEIKKHVRSVGKNNDDRDILNEDSVGSIKNLKDDDLLDALIDIIISEIKTELPSPETTEAQTLHDAFQSFKTALEENIDIMFPAEVMGSELIGAVGGKIDIIKGVLKAVMIRKWMADNDYMPELSEFIIKDDTNGYVFNAFGNFTSFMKNLGDSIVPFLGELQKMTTKLDIKMEKVSAPADGASDTEDTYGETSGGGEEGSDTDTDTNGGDIGGSDDFSDNFGGDENDTAEEPEATPDEGSEESTDEPVEEGTSEEPDTTDTGTEDEPEPEKAEEAPEETTDENSDATTDKEVDDKAEADKKAKEEEEKKKADDEAKKKKEEEDKAKEDAKK